MKILNKGKIVLNKEPQIIVVYNEKTNKNYEIAISHFSATDINFYYATDIEPTTEREKEEISDFLTDTFLSK